MDCQDYITEEPERKSGQHAGRTARGDSSLTAFWVLHARNWAGDWMLTYHRQQRTQRGTPPRKSSRNRARLGVRQSAGRRSTTPIVSIPISRTRLSSAPSFSIGWSSKFTSMASADELNGRPRKKLGYRTPEELFDAFLDRVYTG